MKDQSVFHVYALKDPRSNPSLPFRIGKGAGTRAGDSELIIDQSTKGDRIRQIHAAGVEVLTGNLVEGLSEVEALSKRRTDQCICGEDRCGLLTNSVLPSGLARRRSRNVIVPSEVVEQAQVALEP